MASMPAANRNMFGDVNISPTLQAKLKNSERMLDALINNLNGLVYCCLYDAGWTMVFIGGDCKQLTGYEAASMLVNPSINWEEITHPEDRGWVRKVIDDAACTGQRFVAEYRIVDADGEIRWVSERGCPVYNDQGEIEAIEGFLQNISRRKFSELAAHAAEERFRSIFENAIEGIYQTSADGRYLNINPALAKIYGYDSPADLVRGISNIDKQLYVDQGKRDEFIALMSLQGQVEDFEARVYRKNGEVIWISENSREVRDPGGDLMFYEGIVVDITLRKEMQSEMRRTAGALEQANVKLEEERSLLAQRVEARTAQLRYANRAKDSFLATMSHEIRTPLGGLLGMMELLGLSRLDPDQRDLLGAARSSGNSLLRIVNDILDWSKIEAGKLELAPRAATLSGLLKSVAGTYAQLASAKNLALELEVDPALGATHLFDPLRLSQILNNFTSNAIKFTARGTVRLGARRLAHRAGYDTVCFSVRDSGMGIDREQQARLFQQYQQASADTARMYGGTGLGLAICRSLAELMGGTLGVESSAGAGSTFSFTVELPVANVALPADPGQQRVPGPEPDLTPLAGAGQPPALLIVDDHPLNRMLLKQQLALLGLRADAAADGAEALSLWQSRHFDLIITDCHMPVMDGYELARSIRAIEQHTGARRIPIIAWTANVLAEEEQRCRAAGMDDLLTKPTELAELRAKLLGWLVKAGAIPPPRRPLDGAVVRVEATIGITAGQ